MSSATKQKIQQKMLQLILHVLIFFFRWFQLINAAERKRHRPPRTTEGLREERSGRCQRGRRSRWRWWCGTRPGRRGHVSCRDSRCSGRTFSCLRCIWIPTECCRFVVFHSTIFCFHKYNECIIIDCRKTQFPQQRVHKSK